MLPELTANSAKSQETKSILNNQPYFYIQARKTRKIKLKKMILFIIEQTE